MGRQVRRVPADWQHPKNGRAYVPLYANNDGRPFLQTDEFMPMWHPDRQTHLQMYETTSPGTPLSPPCATAEELAKWLAEHHADAGAGGIATEKEWLAMIEAGQPVAPFTMHHGRGIPAFVKPTK